jgi:5-deoxy-glucuronate isomerase
VTAQSPVLPAGVTAADGFDLVVTPDSAGWSWSSLRTFTLAAGQTRTIATGPEEMIVLPLAGSATVSCAGDRHELAGRRSVFAGPTDFAYLPVDSRIEVGSVAGGRFALCGARTTTRLPFRYGPADEVPVELRGAGRASRLVRNFGTVGSFETGRLIACEVITPDGNWSSYPAHKHDRRSATESELEEIYYFEIAAGPAGEPGFGYMRTSASDDRAIDILAEVHDRDTVLVPYGWHGPCVAAPGFEMYYLNVMAGPADERAWLISDHPDHAFVRGRWTDERIDPRLEGRR